MKYKKSIILLLLAIFLFSITTVCASEIDTPIASEDTTQIGLSDSDKLTEDNLQTSEENPTLTENDETLSSEIDSQILAADQFTYSDLRDKIGSDGDINLTKGTYTYNDGDGEAIVISNSGVINGNGAVIDMNHSGYRAFEITTYSVTIKNLTIKNANFNGDGGAIYFGSSGTVINCNFINNSATQNGGAVFFNSAGNVTKCNFVNNAADSLENCGSAIYMKSGSVENCNFTNNNAVYGKGGAVFFIGSGSVENCNFVNNTANIWGAAVSFLASSYKGNVINCNFIANKVTSGSGGAIYIEEGCEANVKNCNFINNSAYMNGGAIYSYDIYNTPKSIINCNFVANKAILGSGNSIYFYSRGLVENCNFTGNVICNIQDENSYLTVTMENNLDYTNTIHGADTKKNLRYWNGTSYVNGDDPDWGTVKLSNHDILLEIRDSSGVLAEKISRKTDSNGQVVFDYHVTACGLNPGSYIITISNYDYVNITVNKAETKLSGKKITATYNLNKYLIVTLNDERGNPINDASITVDLKGPKTYTTDKNGQIKVSTKGLAPKKYTAKITFAGNAKYIKSTANIKVTVKKATSKLVAKKKTFKAKTKIKKYTVVLKSGKRPIKKAKLTLKVNGKTYKATTNSKGKATFKINKLKKQGTYKATITFKANKYYNKTTKKVKITIKN